MPILLKRAYDAPSRSDGYRILVDRLWPRGLSKQAARIDLWVRDIAPSNELRKWYNHDPEKWVEFKRRYFRELKDQAETLDLVREKIRTGPVTFVFTSRETEFNNAVALRDYLTASNSRTPGGNR